MNKELYRETFSKLRASDQAKEELMNMTEEKKTGKVRTFKVVRNVLIAAALCLALVGTAFAAGVLEINESGFVVLGRFARGLVQDTEGNIAESADPEQIESGTQTVLMPEYTIGARLAEEDGRLILYYQYGPAEGREDVTDAMLEDGTYSMSGAKDGCELSVTVVPCPEEELEEHRYLLLQYISVGGTAASRAFFRIVAKAVRMGEPRPDVNLQGPVASVEKSVSQPLIRSVRFMQVEPPRRYSRPSAPVSSNRLDRQ